MPSELQIVNARVYDPANNIDGEVKNIYVKDGKIVDSVSNSATKIDAHGMVVMPGAIDIHCHIAGPKVNLARKLQPEDHRLDVHSKTAVTRSGTGGLIPSTFATGYRYAAMGYTTAMEAAVPPITARHVLEEFDDTPVIDKGFYVLLGNNAFLYKLLKEDRKKEFKEAIGWWINSAKAYTLKLVNVGSDEEWKGRKNSNITYINQKIHHYDLTPNQITESFIEAAHELGLPHPPHIHCNNLGHSGNISTTLDTMKAAQGRRAHIAHVQFHSFGGKVNEQPISGVRDIIDYINNNENITTDVGQVMFGKATAMTADAPLAWMLRDVKFNKWVNADTECESGCGIIPFSYQESVYTHTLQWAMGLELFLMSKDPWRVLLSTDHPNGGSFMNYPKLIKLLMDSDYRKEAMQHVNQKAIDKTELRDLKREYTLNEITIITRAGPARALGLTNKGHLGIGADADITIYTEEEDKEKMFNAPRYVIKDGVAVIKDHEFVTDYKGKFLLSSPEYDEKITEALEPFFEDFYSIKFSNYPVGDEYLHNYEIIPTNPKS